MASRSARRAAPSLVSSLLVTAALVAGCGEETPPPVVPPVVNGLRFQGPTGDPFLVQPYEVSCAPSDEAGGELTVQVRQRIGGRFLFVEVVPLEEERGFELPVSRGDQESGPRNVFVFLGSDGFEVSTAQEGSNGHLDVLEAGCDPARVRLRVTGTLGSEYSDGEPLTVSGGVDLTDG
ncbi:MAG: hypothetical protein AVDCRST_MAG36-2545 [uncultured Nocardioidaceae bacterium]|uniref:Lipoprotein n=1 Tax=uncultured Nocardioidaceae bacterium TaxID=253824 RepID=A0A6J4MHZ1_9ACTN|nr:MAG: hypothetical protein AVDCRST_MAG36-2545 [uncultured Nocardioidaceae bacterium]